MPKYFPKLTQTQVRIEVADGKSVMVPMLPVKCLTELHECSAALKVADSMEQINAVQARMVEMARQVIPEEYCENLYRFPLTTLAELLAYLMFGDDDDQAKPKPPEPKKN